MGWKLDWRKFRKYLETNYGVTKAFMFIGYMAENEQLYEYMHELGYLIVLKPTVDISANQPDELHIAKDQSKPSPPANSTDTSAKAQVNNPEKSPEKSEKSSVKGNIDADLVLYAMKEFANYQKAIIVSGDGDFYGLIEHLEQTNKLANILTPNWQYSSLLKQFEPKIVRLDQLRKELTYHDRKKK